MASSCNQESGTVNIINLPTASQIKGGDYLIVEVLGGSTHILDFKDFVIGLDNTSFKPAFETMQDEVTILAGASANWETTHTVVVANSAIWNNFDPSLYSIDCWNATCTAVTGNSANWDEAYSWGNHANMGYSTGQAPETDPTVPAHVKAITAGNISTWNVAYDRVNVTPGTGTANKALIVDANRDITNIRNLTVTGEIRAAGDVIAFDQGNPSPGSSTPTGIGTTITNPGVILQVKEVTYNLGEAAITSTNSTFTHIFSGAITPSSSSNKVLVQAYLQVYGADTASNWDAPQCYMTVRRLNTDGTTAFSFISNGSNEDGFWIYQRENHQTPSYVGGPIMCMRLDSPNTTDEVVYDVVAKIAGNYTSMYVYGGIMHMQEIAG